MSQPPNKQPTPADPPLPDRYTIDHPVDMGGITTTYRGRDTDTGDTVAIRELALEQVEDWKSVELFEREADVLRRLDHPGLPEYIDARTVEEHDTGMVRHYLVVEFVDGDNLRDLLRDGTTFDEFEARALAEQLLEILAYLHDRKPPVVHRDVEPANIIRRPDGDWALVDFGVVQQVWQDTVGGDTFVGTAGYLPPEQAAGRATEASDVYALGATLVEVLSGHAPGDFPTDEMALQFRGRVGVSEPFADFLEAMLEPVPEDRFDDAGEALAALRRLPEPESDNDLPAESAGDKLVSDSDVRRRLTASGQLEVRIPVRDHTGPRKVDIGPVRVPSLVTYVVLLILGVLVFAGLQNGAPGAAVVFGAVAAALGVKAVGQAGGDTEIQLQIEPYRFRMVRHRRWFLSPTRSTRTLQGSTVALRKALSERRRLERQYEREGWSDRVDEHLPGSATLAWVVGVLLTVDEVGALEQAIRRLEREA
jgi:HAMP domain-containing protein